MVGMSLPKIQLFYYWREDIEHMIWSGEDKIMRFGSIKRSQSVNSSGQQVKDKAYARKLQLTAENRELGDGS